LVLDQLAVSIYTKACPNVAFMLPGATLEIDRVERNLDAWSPANLSHLVEKIWRRHLECIELSNCDVRERVVFIEKITIRRPSEMLSGVGDAL
jgi:hypothetical protein